MEELDEKREVKYFFEFLRYFDLSLCGCIPRNLKVTKASLHICDGESGIIHLQPVATNESTGKPSGN